MHHHLWKQVRLIVMGFPLLASAQTDCRVTYIANEGFMIEAGNKKILVDALFGGFETTWCDKPSDETKSRLENAEPPFDHIDIAAVSHLHQDHFNQAMVIDHVIHNPSVIILCPRQVKEMLMKSPEFEKISRNILSCTPPIGQDTVVDAHGVPVRFLRLEHGAYFETDEKTGEKVNRHRNVENIGYVFEIDGMKIFHSGDANSKNPDLFKGFEPAFKNLDLAFLDRIFIYSDQAPGIEIVENMIKPCDVVLMHLEPNSHQKYRDVASRVASRVPRISIFNNFLESRGFQKTGE